MSEPRFIDKGPAAAPLSGRTSPQHDEQPVEKRDASRASEEAPGRAKSVSEFEYDQQYGGRSLLPPLPERKPCTTCGTECDVICVSRSTFEQYEPSRYRWTPVASPSGSGRDETLPEEPSEAAILAAASAGYDEEWESGGDFKLISALRAAYAAERLSTGSPSVSGGEERSKG